MPLNVITGDLGAGKSFYAVRKVIEHLERGDVVVTNFKMAPDFIDRVVDRHPVRWAIPGRRRRLKERWKRCFYVVENLEELMRIRVAGEGEARWVAIVDEAHEFLNSRSWKDDDRKEILRWVSLSRKLGAEVYFVTQDLQSLDRQVRDRLTYHIELQNMKRFKAGGIPVLAWLPRTLFLALWKMPHTGKKHIIKREVYFLNYMRSLYDTMDTSSFELVEPADVILLPAPAPSRPTGAAALARATSAGGAAARRRDPSAEPLGRLLQLSDAIRSGDKPHNDDAA